MTYTHAFLRRGALRGAVRGAAAGSLAVAASALSACDLNKTLHVTDVDVATPGAVANKAGLPVVYAGGRADFSVAFGGTDHAVTMPGLLTDELRDIDTFPTRIEVDQRNITTVAGGLQTTNGTIGTWYRNMHQARASLERATAAFAQFDASNPQRAELHALDGFVYVMFAEDFCNGIAFSKLDETGATTFGAPQTTTQVLDRAIAQFDSATAVAKAGTPEAYLAQLGKARALLDQNKVAEAAVAAASVPVTFQYQVAYSENSNRENNGVHVNTGPVSKRFAVADKDGINGLAFRTLGWNQATGTGDIRVRWYQSGIGQDGASPAYYTLKYANRSAPITLADGIEAQLIIAENQLKNNDVTGYLKTLNDLRANTTLLGRAPITQSGQTATALPALTDPGTVAGRVDQLFAERAFWLYLTGHRLGDMRRLIKYYGRNAESVFPTGTYTGAAGGTFGKDVNFPVYVDEQNNTAAPQCTDRNP
ncbi:membrane or secreted protein [Gemmatirosa kalamazoonensis]|uniref:Membrane or secreted protein n=1 Tax=Gemmatirosa kalamazoonensis TaxID=861299 RepID=W0RHA6_9BACT|nr:hypothetical protein [Gemmatirosa kalamazoonensis]AHG90171.1 membrane or secreted protein [Gemmatirosa kalamazoonensis]